MSILFQQPCCSGRDREPQDKTHWTAEMLPTSPTTCCQWSSIFLPTAIPCPGLPRREAYGGVIQCPLHVLRILLIKFPTTTLVSLTNSSAMKHDHKTDRISDLRGLIRLQSSQVHHVCESLNWVAWGELLPIVFAIKCRAVNKISISGHAYLNYSTTLEKTNNIALCTHRAKLQRSLTNARRKAKSV